MKNQKNVCGWIFLDKPIGMSSNMVLQKVRKVFFNCKAGYVGTLDPLASGFLPIALGKATKTIKFLEKSYKEYVFTVKWGLQTSTGDLEGDIITNVNKFPNLDDIKNTLKKFFGETLQTPHKFSSKKINGIRAYKLARKNKKFKLKKNKIDVKNFLLVTKNSNDKTTFYIKCSSGTYIRSLAEDMAKIMRTYGTLIALRRIGFGEFNKKLISLDYLLSLVHSETQIKTIKPISSVFRGVNQIDLDRNEFDQILNGRSIKMKTLFDKKKINADNDFTFAKFQDKVVALGYRVKEEFHPKKIFEIL